MARVAVYVDVQLGHGMDGGALIRSVLESMGATVYKRWPGANSRATHLVLSLIHI